MPNPAFRRALAATALLAAATAAQAQIKTDGLWRGSAGASLSVNSGNTDSQALAASVDMVTATTADKISLGGGISYARSKAAGVTSTTANKWFGMGQYDYNLGPRMFVFGKLGLEGDELLDLTLRTTLAAGVGYKLVESPSLNFTVFGGAGYVTDKYDDPKTVDGRTKTTFSRASLMLGEESSHVLSPTTTFKQRLEVYPGLSGDKAVIAKFTAGLGVAISSTMNLTVGLSNNYNSKPPAGFKKSDLALFTGISVKLGAN